MNGVKIIGCENNKSMVFFKSYIRDIGPMQSFGSPTGLDVFSRNNEIMGVSCHLERSGQTATYKRI